MTVQDKQSQLVSVDFHGQSVLAILRDGKPYVAMRPIVENIGLDWKSQYARINRHAILKTSVVMMTTQMAGDDQRRGFTFLPLSMLNGWLFGVDSNRVREDVQPKLIRYQLECFDVLHRHFMGQQPPRFAVPGALYAKALQAERDEAASFALASLAGKSLRQRRKEKKVIGEILVMLREEVQLKLLLGHIDPPAIAHTA